MAKNNSGCSFGKVSRNMVENVTQDFKEFRKEIREEFVDLKNTNTKLYNHLSSRLPAWATIFITLASSLITGLTIWGLSK